MKIEIKDDSKEKGMVMRAAGNFGFKDPTDFVRAAIRSYYSQCVEDQLVKAAEFRNKELEENPGQLEEMKHLQGV